MSCGALHVQVLHAQGGVARQAPERLARLRYGAGGTLLACQSAGKLVELFRCALVPGPKQLLWQHKDNSRADLLLLC